MLLQKRNCMPAYFKRIYLPSSAKNCRIITQCGGILRTLSRILAFDFFPESGNSIRTQQLTTMAMNIASTLGGLAGACALTLLNEGVKKFDKNAPRLDLLGQNALAKIMKGNTVIPQTAQKVSPLVGDLITNSLYYGMARGASNGNTLWRGALLGVTAGLGAVTIPQALGLPHEPAAQTNKTKLMTIGWYLLGGLIAAAVINAIDQQSDRKPADNELKKATVNAGKAVAREGVKSVLHA